jgi:hypothetical protein
MARKHECPDCGASHEMSTAGRIERLEKRVKELEADRNAHRCDHHYCNHWWWTNTYYPTTTTQPVITYTDNGTVPVPTTYTIS